MRQALPVILSALAAGEPVALATVVRTWSSAPYPAGTTMAVTADGVAVGSVSGGCVEGEVYERCQAVLSSGAALRTTYGVSDDDAFAVGLTCGGTLEIAVAPARPADAVVFQALADALARFEPVVLAVALPPRGDATGARGGQSGGRLVVGADAVVGSLGRADLDAVVAEAARHHGRSGSDAAVLTLPGGGGVEVLVVPFLPAPRLVVLGAAGAAAALCRAGALLGYRVSVVDARPVFATAARFPDADEVVVDWPHRWLAAADLDERDAVCVLTHDPKFDVPALVAALRTPAGYIGALGSRRTHGERVLRLREAGVRDDELARVRAPIGLDLGARTPEETAVSILAEIVRDLRGGTGESLAGGTGAIHRRRL